MKKSKSKPSVAQELDAIGRKHNGVLRPEDIVEFARDPKTALHSRFQWDDTEAAHQFRLEQARRIVRVHVVLIKSPRRNQPIKVRQWHSLPSDRGGASYRKTVTILSSKDMRRELVQQALDELDSTRMKYQHLRELAEVWNSIKRAKKSVSHVA